ncbi:hypothetical protein LF1_13560 [Rubripirellula obstinata]|uniref:Uncharacterized protein n=1 Tax=Rubripirellula obstinata TaxID=406547 RepID=A0A5B1CF45_9BACT|nr:hypothetical protein [Rubripirellula obstinata]KAA1258832.1 hypothetical protein LF1_13560 [Rubripirellula obstinata]
MLSIFNVIRRSHIVLLMGVACFACEPTCLGQETEWSPYRETDRSREQISRRVQQKQIKLPPPVRLAQFQEPTIQSIQPDDFGQQHVDHSTLHREAVSGFSESAPAHAVIRPPAARNNQRSTASGSRSHSLAHPGGHHAGNSSHSDGLFHQDDRQHLPGPPLHGQHLKFAKKKWPLGPMQPRQANIPGGRERPTWKQPYSYGYFGSSSNRHWGTHHGYRDRYTEYRYR